MTSSAACRRRPSPIAALISLAVLAATACTAETSDRDIVFIGTDDARHINRGDRGLLGLGGAGSVVWVDPRSEAKYRERHVADAISIPFQHITEQHQRLRDYDLIIVYGDDDRDPLAQAMSKQLITLGYDDVRTLEGGLATWFEAGHPTVGE